MLRTASAPSVSAPDHVIEEMAVLQIEMLTVDIQIKKLQAKREWLELLHENFMRRFQDFC